MPASSATVIAVSFQGSAVRRGVSLNGLSPSPAYHRDHTDSISSW
jgi:hypothetical protein